MTVGMTRRFADVAVNRILEFGTVSVSQQAKTGSAALRPRPSAPHIPAPWSSLQRGCAQRDAPLRRRTAIRHPFPASCSSLHRSLLAAFRCLISGGRGHGSADEQGKALPEGWRRSGGDGPRRCQVELVDNAFGASRVRLNLREVSLNRRK
jgi:hypothetical protein